MEEVVAYPPPPPSGQQQARVAAVRYDDPSVVKYLVENQIYIENFTKMIRGWVLLPAGDGGELAWVDTMCPMVNKQGVLWLTGKLIASTDKMVYLSNYPKERLKSILTVEYEGIAVHLACHLEEYDLKAQDCEFLMGMMRTILESAFRRPIGDKERGHIYGSVEETTTNKPQDQGKMFGIFPKF